jgi:hypothetical protein
VSYEQHTPASFQPPPPAHQSQSLQAGGYNGTTANHAGAGRSPQQIAPQQAVRSAAPLANGHTDTPSTRPDYGASMTPP